MPSLSIGPYLASAKIHRCDLLGGRDLTISADQATRLIGRNHPQLRDCSLSLSLSLSDPHSSAALKV